jgi:vacuolar-type H+-ATPase subunit I/STV1
MRKAEIQLFGSPILFLGAIFFLIAKISVVRKGQYFTFGCDNMSNKMMWSYFIGYILMIIGYIITFSVVSFK